LGYPLSGCTAYRKLTRQSTALREVDFRDGLERFGEEGLGV
jgi:hypothetical protein